MRSASIRRTTITTALVLLASAALSGAATAAAYERAPQRPTASHGSSHDRSTRRVRTTWDSVYTDEQATRGQSSYNRTCARCHQESLAGADESPALAGGTFMSNWNGLTLGELHARVKKSMPSDDPGTYGPQLITDVIAYVLKVNGFPAGKVELTHEGDALNSVQFSAARP